MLRSFALDSLVAGESSRILIGMNIAHASSETLDNRCLHIEETRLISDLRIMHSKVDELYQIVQSLRTRHDETAVQTYAERCALQIDVDRVDEIYLWFVALKDQTRVSA
jgi:phosphate uptake regulator